MVIYLFLSYVFTKLVQFRSVANRHLYVAMRNDYAAQPGHFLPVSKIVLKELPDYCGKPAIRHIHEDYYELYFCGKKMCYDREKKILTGCFHDELDTKWRLVPSGTNYKIQMGDLCMTLTEISTFNMQKCEFGVDINQLFNVIPVIIRSPFAEEPSNDPGLEEIKLSRKLAINEEYFRKESMMA